MVQSLTRPTKGLSEAKRWPFYRGCRAGKQFKERESFKRHGITRIERTRSANRRSITVISGHVADNCTTIRPEKPLPARGSKSMFVPAFMVSNVQSLSPKIDEVRVMISNANLDFACTTETWLKDHINDHTVSVSGYKIIRREAEGGVNGRFFYTPPYSQKFILQQPRGFHSNKTRFEPVCKKSSD